MRKKTFLSLLSFLVLSTLLSWGQMREFMPKDFGPYDPDLIKFPIEDRSYPLVLEFNYSNNDILKAATLSELLKSYLKNSSMKYTGTLINSSLTQQDVYTCIKMALIKSQLKTPEEFIRIRESSLRELKKVNYSPKEFASDMLNTASVAALAGGTAVQAVNSVVNAVWGVASNMDNADGLIGTGAGTVNDIAGNVAELKQRGRIQTTTSLGGAAMAGTSFLKTLWDAHERTETIFKNRVILVNLSRICMFYRWLNYYLATRTKSAKAYNWLIVMDENQQSAPITFRGMDDCSLRMNFFTTLFKVFDPTNRGSQGLDYEGTYVGYIRCKGEYDLSPYDQKWLNDRSTAMFRVGEVSDTPGGPNNVDGTMAAFQLEFNIVKSESDIKPHITTKSGPSSLSVYYDMPVVVDLHAKGSFGSPDCLEGYTRFIQEGESIPGKKEWGPAKGVQTRINFNFDKAYEAYYVLGSGGLKYVRAMGAKEYTGGGLYYIESYEYDGDHLIANPFSHFSQPVPRRIEDVVGSAPTPGTFTVNVKTTVDPPRFYTMDDKEYALELEKERMTHLLGKYWDIQNDSE